MAEDIALTNRAGGGSEDAMKLTVVGCGDAFGSGGRLQTSYHVRTADTQFLIDCGASTLIGLDRQGIAANDIDTIWVDDRKFGCCAATGPPAPTTARIAAASTRRDGQDCRRRMTPAYSNVRRGLRRGCDNSRLDRSYLDL